MKPAETQSSADSHAAAAVDAAAEASFQRWVTTYAAMYTAKSGRSYGDGFRAGAAAWANAAAASAARAEASLHVEMVDAYERGRRDERLAIVAWLHDVESHPVQGTDYLHWSTAVRDIADAIYGGAADRLVERGT